MQPSHRYIPHTVVLLLYTINLSLLKLESTSFDIRLSKFHSFHFTSFFIFRTYFCSSAKSVRATTGQCGGVPSRTIPL